MGTIVNRLLSLRTVAERTSHRRADLLRGGGTTDARNQETGSGPHLGSATEETQVSVRGVIRLDMVHLLPRYGTAYGLFDEPTADYDCALKSDAYRLEDWVGDYVEVSGPLTESGHGLPVLRVVCLRLVAPKWMR